MVVGAVSKPRSLVYRIGDRSRLLRPDRHFIRRLLVQVLVFRYSIYCLLERRYYDTREVVPRNAAYCRIVRAGKAITEPNTLLFKRLILQFRTDPRSM